MYVSVLKTLLFCMLSLQKTNFYHSFHSLIFQSKTHSHPGTFFERGWGNSLKETYVEEEGGGGYT